MKATSLKKAIEKRGGKAKIQTKTVKGEGWEREHTTLIGQVSGYDVEMIGEESSFFTVREVSKRGFYDAGSDYNSGDYKFCDRVKDLDWAIS